MCHFEILDKYYCQSCKEHNLKYEVFSSFEVDLSGTVEENFINYQKIAEEMLGQV